MKLTNRELQAISWGEDLEEFRQRHRRECEVRERSKYFDELAPELWPTKPIAWLLSPDAHRFSLDGVSQHDFDSNYSDGLLVGRTDFESFDRVISEYSHRKMEELWEAGGCNDKLAKIIAWVDMGYDSTPVFIKPDEYSEHTVILVGGNHRYAFYKGRHEDRIPFLCEPKHKKELSRRLEIEWLHNDE